jgi:hypothetical protein
LRANSFAAFLIDLAACPTIVHVVVFACLGAFFHDAFVSFHDWFDKWIERASDVEGCPTGHIFLQKYLFSLKLDRIAITGIAQSSRMMSIILPDMLVNVLR